MGWPLCRRGPQIEPGTESKTSLYWLINDRLVEFAELPSGGDNSYPGLVELSHGARAGVLLFEP